MGKTKTDVKTVPRAMGKLLKEAERVKLILSANTDCFAQIENVMEDIDFKHPMSREKLMEMSTDLMDRVTGPVQRALTTASMSMENIDQVILVGGGTRVPRVQELLTEFVGQELGMLFAHAKTQAETFTEQAVKDAVITSAVYFNQAERLALVAAAQLGGLNVLQLMNVPMAVALNYGTFRRKEINGTVKMRLSQGSKKS